MNGTRRFLGLAVLGGALALLWVASRWATGPTYITLFRDMELSGVSAVTDELTKAGIRYRLESGGNEVLVPTGDVARARVLLAKDGLPANGRPGLELFDKPSWGMTDFTQRITYRRALEGELARTLGSLKGVQRAQVHLALPESSPLRRLERPAQAAVVLSLKAGVTLSADEVQGIAYIVANSVEQLPADNVAVMDDAGHVLSLPDGAGAGLSGLSTRQNDMQHSVERQIADKAEAFLATVVGPRQARVQVSARLNFEQVERTIESYDPDGQVLQNEQRSEAIGGDSSADGGSQTIISNQYQNSKKVERIIGAVGAIGKLTVAVLVDEAALAAEAKRSGRDATAELASLEAAVRNAIGVDSTRGDRLTIAAMPFETSAAASLLPPPADSAAAGPGVTVIVERFSRPAILLIGVILAFIVALRLMRPAAVPGQAGATAALPAGGADDATPLFARPAPSASVQLRSQVQALSADRPEAAAQVIRAWMAEA